MYSYLIYIHRTSVLRLWLLRKLISVGSTIECHILISFYATHYINSYVQACRCWPLFSHLRSRRLLTFPICLSDVLYNQISILNVVFLGGVSVWPTLTVHALIPFCTRCFAPIFPSVSHSPVSDLSNKSNWPPSLVWIWQHRLQVVSEARLSIPDNFFCLKVSGQIEAIFSVSCAVMLFCHCGRDTPHTSWFIYTGGKVCVWALQEKCMVTHTLQGWWG